MTVLVTGTFRHKAEPFDLLWCMMSEVLLEGSNARAVTVPISDRRRLSDLPALVNNRVEL
ncbi:MAG TPA: hypothetical protein VNF26_08650 [Candidatus Baltobacterales bacterium]|nr:hypothetical protein [Candidatus Baltobacterales bacterium]